jgi:putative MFS transporter
MGVSAFWLLLALAFIFADGGFAIVGPYAAEVWPAHLRTPGMGLPMALAASARSSARSGLP